MANLILCGVRGDTIQTKATKER